jgi:hypothetical protein
MGEVADSSREEDRSEQHATDKNYYAHFDSSGLSDWRWKLL